MVFTILPLARMVCLMERIFFFTHPERLLILFQQHVGIGGRMPIAGVTEK